MKILKGGENLKFNLDFNIELATDRLEAIKSIDLSSLTKSELETISNYILYGKDPNGTSPVDRKEIQIKTKFNSYHKDRTTSLEALMESPTFDENIFSKDRTVYKKVKPQIDLEKAKEIDGMEELWEQIQATKKSLEKLQENPQENSSQIYYLKHLLIELYTQQYYLIDSVQKTILPKKNKFEFHANKGDFQLNFPILPRGVVSQQFDLSFFEPYYYGGTAPAQAIKNEEKILEGNRPYFDFRNREHLYYLIQHYEELQDEVRNQPDSLIWNFLWTLDFYIEKAGLSEQQAFIVELKKKRLPNKDIQALLQTELGIYHKENYISTIWNKAVGLICAAVELNYDEYLCKNYEKAWKQCKKCGRFLLKDSRNFVKKSRAIDGLTSRCKRCDRDLRRGITPQRIEYPAPAQQTLEQKPE